MKPDTFKRCPAFLFSRLGNSCPQAREPDRPPSQAKPSQAKPRRADTAPIWERSVRHLRISSIAGGGFERKVADRHRRVADPVRQGVPVADHRLLRRPGLQLVYRSASRCSLVDTILDAAIETAADRDTRPSSLRSRRLLSLAGLAAVYRRSEAHPLKVPQGVLARQLRM